MEPDQKEVDPKPDGAVVTATTARRRAHRDEVGGQAAEVALAVAVAVAAGCAAAGAEAAGTLPSAATMSAKTEIGDSHPMAKPELTRAIEEILADAAKDPEFRSELLVDRNGAIERRSYSLSDTEKNLLDAVPEEQLRALLDTLSRSDAPGIFKGQPGQAMPLGPPAGIRPK